jgi:type VI secretion system secreted protein Hcp
MSCASPKLFDACATGKHIDKAILTCRKAGGKQEVFYTLTLTDVLVSSYQIASLGVQGGPTAMDKFSLNFGRIEVAYKEQNVKGGTGAPVQSGWDVRKNTKV